MISNKQKYELYKPKKFLGQNFLVDNNIAIKIVASLEVNPGDTVIEIGPGQGVLTRLLKELTKDLYSVEIDRSIFEKLGKEFCNTVKLIHKDFLKLDLEKDLDTYNKKLKVIGNIPYNITTEILFKLFDSKDKIHSAVLMMQKEVARRLNALPDTKDYGILAIQTQLHADPRILFNVSPTSFFPKPNVNSSVVKLDFNKDKYPVLDKALFKAIVRESFGKRRKTMKNSLSNFFESKDIDQKNIEFDFSRRPENVTVSEFVDLSNTVAGLIRKTGGQ